MDLLNSLLGGTEKNLLFFGLAAYISFRLAPYGEDKADKIILYISGIFIALVIPLYFLGGYFHIVAIAATLIVLIFLFFVFIAGIPGMRVKFPVGRIQHRIVVEICIVSVLTLIARGAL